MRTEEDPDPRRRRGAAIVLGATVLTLGVGYLVKLPCLGTPWDGRQYTRLCYSDVYALYASDDRDRGLDDNRFPYLEGENEYPALNGIAMYLTALPATSHTSYFLWNSVLLGAGALATAWTLQRLAGRRALYFALAPTLAIYAFMSWDLIAVAFATLGTLAFLRNRNLLAGVLLGLGAAAKLYPVLFVLPFALDRLVRRRPDGAARVAGGAVAAWGAVNLPFAILSFDRWSWFFRFNAERVADWDSLWYSLQARGTWSTSAVNLLVAASLAGATLVVLALWWRRRDEIPAWTLAFPLLVVFLLTSKVYSPQYSLWLLPWFALVLPKPWLFVAFEAADVAVFVTRFEFFARNAGVGTGVPQAAFEAAVFVRAAILVICVVTWAGSRTRAPDPEPAAVPVPA